MESGRGGNGYGWVPFTWADFRSFFALYGFSPKPWQLRALRQMEIIWTNHKNKKQDEVSSRPMTPEMFDALM